MLKKKAKTVTANEFINLANVRGQFLYTKDNMIWQFIKVQPISTALMNEKEKELLTLKMTREVSPTKVPFKILFFSRPTDVRQIIEYYENIKASTDDTKKRDCLSKTIKYFSKLSTGNGVLERQTFIALWTQNEKQKEDDLMQKTIEFRNSLSASGVHCSIADEKELIAMLGLFYNPSFSSHTCVDVTNKYTFLEGYQDGK